ncbi:MAG: biopolymer transporter ExbD [Deltaproteobacteria bacterium]|nr:biopolymer transporter ExbD [Deltaproteobacteria bacterium]
MDFSPSRRRLPLILDLTPLIDVVFLLLIFFMVTTTFVPDSTGLQVDLPRSSSQEVIQEGEDLTLDLGADGTISLNGEVLSLAQLSAELRKTAEKDPKTLIVLKADSEISHGRVVEVMDMAREIGLTSFAIATEGEATGGTEAPAASPSLPSWLRNPLE